MQKGAGSASRLPVLCYTLSRRTAHHRRYPMIRSLYVVPAVIALLFLLPALSSAVPEGLSLTWSGGGAGTVVFDGTVHAKKGLNCDACHVAGQFHTRKGADAITMDALKKEQ